MIDVYVDEGEHAVWSNTEDGGYTGRCVGVAPTLEAALIDAEKELRTDLTDVQARLTAERDRLKAEAALRS